MRNSENFNRSGSLSLETSQALSPNPHYDFIILNFGNHIELAAHAVEQWRRANEEFGFVKAYFGYSPHQGEALSPSGPEQAYLQNYYWKVYLGIPFFCKTIGGSKWVHLKASLRAVFSTARSLSRALICSIGRGTDGVFQSIRTKSVRSLCIGPAVLSDYLRRDYLKGYSGYLKFDIEFVKIMYDCHRYLHYWLDICPQQKFSRVLFSCAETTYREEVARQALLSRGAKEIFMHRWSESTFSLWSTHREGWESQVAHPDARRVKTDDLEEARKHMASRLSGHLNYVYMSSDVSHKPLFNPDPCKHSGRLNAVIYLHLVTDAQHAWGPDCFNDLHHWLRVSIRLLSQQGFRIFLKLHPLCVSPRLSGDAQYKAHLENWLGVSWDDLTFGQVLPSRHAEIFIVNHQVPVKAMRELLGSFLCVTHHGVIATEAASIGIPVVMSRAGPYRNFPQFAFLYESISQYEELLQRYSREEMEVTSEMDGNLYFYLASVSRDWHKWLWTAFGEMSGQPFFSDPEATYKLIRKISDRNCIPESLQAGFGGSRPVINIDGIDRVRCDALGHGNG